MGFGILAAIAWLSGEGYDSVKQSKKTEQDRIESAERKANFGSKMSNDKKEILEMLKNL